MISLSSPTADTAGVVCLDDKGLSKLDEAPARISRKKCLDATSYISHSGVVDGDRTFVIVVPRITEAEFTIIKRLHRNYTSVIVACKAGVFSGGIKSCPVSNGTCKITILIEEKLNA